MLYKIDFKLYDIINIRFKRCLMEATLATLAMLAI